MADKRIATVSQINSYLKTLLDNCTPLQNIWVRGEISNFKNHYSGHLYLTLKDEGSVMRAVMFRGAAGKLSFTPENGQKVLARGRIAVFERDGQYQLYIEEMEPDGIGNLHMEFERLKNALREEGLFDEDRKKAIPKFPKTIGVITSGTGAAVRDILNILGRRYPLAEVKVFPVLVQGPDASADIVRAISYFNRTQSADVLIVGRGGGSIEDLWAFNEEKTARAIAASEIPIISAVGHETDFTISDFVADLRAPTPSAAAELAVPSGAELKNSLEKAQKRMAQALLGNVKLVKSRLERVKKSAVFTHPTRFLEPMRQTLDQNFDKICHAQEGILSQRKEAFSVAVGKLEALSPMAVLARGYAIPQKADGSTLRKKSDVSVGEEINLSLSDGRLKAQVTEVE